MESETESHEGEQYLIKAERCADGFTFDLSMQHIIEQVRNLA